MTDGPPNIAPALGGLLGLGVLTVAAKGLIDTMKDKSKNKEMYREPKENIPRPENDVIDRGLNRMLGRR